MFWLWTGMVKNGIRLNVLWLRSRLLLFHSLIAGRKPKIIVVYLIEFKGINYDNY